MLVERSGDMIKSVPQGGVIGIPVNCVGVAGKGLAKWMKVRFPKVTDYYIKQCRNGSIGTGVLSVIDTGWNDVRIALIPTKFHWKPNSPIELIEVSLVRLKSWMLQNDIREVHLPKLGCGNKTGSLDWEQDVKPLFVKIFGSDEAFNERRLIVYRGK